MGSVHSLRIRLQEAFLGPAKAKPVEAERLLSPVADNSCKRNKGRKVFVWASFLLDGNIFNGRHETEIRNDL